MPATIYNQIIKHISDPTSVSTIGFVCSATIAGPWIRASELRGVLEKMVARWLDPNAWTSVKGCLKMVEVHRSVSSTGDAPQYATTTNYHYLESACEQFLSRATCLSLPEASGIITLETEAASIVIHFHPQAESNRPSKKLWILVSYLLASLVWKKKHSWKSRISCSAKKA